MTSSEFQRALDHIRLVAESKYDKGDRFERLMQTIFRNDPVFGEQFSNVWRWTEWARERPDFDGRDMGIDLVAELRQGGYCAIQCKCYASGTRISKPDIQSFIAASNREPFTERILVNTGHELGAMAKKVLDGLQPACRVIQFSNFEQSFDWASLSLEQPEALERSKTFDLRPHQRDALDDVVAGFEDRDKGKLVMACGTGKTFASLRIAETVVGVGGRVLYLVPSISLFQQTMREWATQRAMPHRYVGICSDTRAGRNDEDATLQELEIPVTTDPEAISSELLESHSEAMTVVFSTYHSLGLVEKAQDAGAPPFDLVLCDEAHRTTGIERPGDKASPFVLIHDEERIRAERRLYMTATPRLYTEGAKRKAADHAIEVFSMDDEGTYGPEFHRLPFSRAVEQNLLSDYKVVILTVSEEHVSGALQAHLASSGGELNLDDAAKIVGCWRALQNPENRPGDGPSPPRLKRAIAFTNLIKHSERLAKYWPLLVEQATDLLPDTERDDVLRCETQHVDGRHHALDRKARIEWLKGEEPGVCRILSNARCLSEGIDVPALDAVLFMNPRNSHVDIVQAVGRAMRKAEGKTYGYIILPVVVPAGADPASVLDDNERFAAVWGVLRALRSHDDRFDAEINKIDLNRQPTPRIIIFPDGPGGDAIPDAPTLPFPPLSLPPGAIYAKIVEKCGDRKYWESWAKDVADIFSRLVYRIESLLADPRNRTLRQYVDYFVEELRVSINDSLTRTSAVDMMAQHLLTRPVFEALFEQYDFAGKNPVAKALDALRRDFGEFGLENETQDLEPFYRSVRLRAQGLDNSEARQRVLMELYEKFFATALKKEADRLGIVYTPVQVVDFILHSADDVLRREFGRGLTDEGVHLLDPFTGTGIFLVRLLQSGLIGDDDVERKYREELHANEIVLLAYYIAAIHVEEAFHGRRADRAYMPFGGIVLTDTFNLRTDRTSGFPREWLPDNSERVERQQNSPIQVIVGNPPWSVGQRSSADDNPNVDYPELEKRVADTYAARSTATLKNSLYDTYKMAIRWASDRIGEQGVIALVTNGSWIEGNVDSGVRACLVEEFSSVYVLNLRGNARTSGELRRSEGDNVFGQGSRAPVAITVLVRKPDARHDGCRIFYRDIGDHLKREEKLAIVREAGSIAGVDEWQEIKPDRYHDWVGQRSEAFQEFYPVASKDVKAGKSSAAVFGLFSRGLATSRDAYIYNFSRDACAENARRMVEDYLGAVSLRESNPGVSVEEAARRHSEGVRWDRELKNNLKRQRSIILQTDGVRATQYRPFVKQHCYVEYVLMNNKYQMDRIFPGGTADNRAICVPGVGSTKPFSALVVDSVPDLHFVAFGQCLPRYEYPVTGGVQGKLTSRGGADRIDNVTDDSLLAFRSHYGDDAITKDQIFNYVYGIFHAPEYRAQFANDLAKELPRIPFAPDFHAFAQAGHELADLHLGYESGDEYPLELVFADAGEPGSERFRLGAKAMRFADTEKTVLAVNDFIRLAGVPAEAHEYQVNGRTPLEWFIDRYKVKQDKRSGIVNDPNGWFENPGDLVTAIRRIVHVSVETVRIVHDLPGLASLEPFHAKDR